MTENTNSGCSQRDSAEHEGYVLQVSLGELLEKDNYENEEWLISAYRTMSPEKQRMLQVYADMLLHYDREM